MIIRLYHDPDEPKPVVLAAGLAAKWLLVIAAAGLAVTVALTLDLLWRLP